MEIKELRKQLAYKKAAWTIPANIGENLVLKDLSNEYYLGSNPEPPGTLTARLPKIRKADENLFAKWQPQLLYNMRATSTQLARKWDWRDVENKNWVSPAKNQGRCGSCVPFAVLATMETHYRLLRNSSTLAVDLSEAALFFSNKRVCSDGDPRSGMNITKALNYITDEGVCFEENYPYRAVNQTAELVQGTELTLKSMGFDSTTQTFLMKKWLVEEGPLVANFKVYEDFDAYWRSGANGVYSYLGTTDLRGSHAVAVIGYDEDQKCWICKNSWGETPNSDRNGPNRNGVFRIGYGQVGIDDRMFILQDVHRITTRDEISYNPRRLRIVNEGTKGWLLTDGTSRMKLLDNKEDARNALRVARRHTRHGFIGRDNDRTNRSGYIIEYWAGSSGLPYEPLTKVDSIPYNPANIVAEHLSEQGWRLKEGGHWMQMAHDFNDALALLQVAERHTKMCFIGRSNKRSNRRGYIMTYWE